MENKSGEFLYCFFTIYSLLSFLLEVPLLLDFFRSCISFIRFAVHQETYWVSDQK